MAVSEKPGHHATSSGVSSGVAPLGGYRRRLMDFMLLQIAGGKLPAWGYPNTVFAVSPAASVMAAGPGFGVAPALIPSAYPSLPDKKAVGKPAMLHFCFPIFVNAIC